MPITNRTFVRSTLSLLLVGLISLVAIVGVAFWLGIKTQDSFDRVLAARDLRSAAIDLRSSLQDAETGQRGFLLTGRSDYLAPYIASKTAVLAQASHLATLLGPDHVLARSQASLMSAISGKLAELAETVALKQSGKDADALTIVNDDQGKALMDQARADLQTIIDAAENRITAAVADQRWSSSTLGWVSVIGALVIALVFGGAAITVVRYTRELGAARDEVAALNTGLEQRVSERTADLTAANEEIQRFAYIVTHDLRAPLVNIMGFTAELEASIAQIRNYLARLGNPAEDDAVAAEAHKATDADLPEAIGFIRSSTTKMDGLIAAILKLAREGGRVMRTESVNLTELLEASIKAVQHQLSEAAGEVSLDVETPVMVSDRLALGQVIGNLLDNAIKYRAKGRPLRITITVRPAPSGRIRIEVADNGRGIAPQDHERVFELFRRAGAQDQPGEGIGLPHVRRIARNLGGDIRMHSVLGEGTSFVVTLPRAIGPLKGEIST